MEYDITDIVRIYTTNKFVFDVKDVLQFIWHDVKYTWVTFVKVNTAM